MNNFKSYISHFFEYFRKYFRTLQKIYEVWQSHKFSHSRKCKDVYVKICRCIFARYLISGLFTNEYSLFFKRYITTVEHPSLKCFQLVKTSVKFPYEKILAELLDETGFDFFETDDSSMLGTKFFFRRKMS